MLWGVGASLGFPVGMSAAADDPVRAASRVSVVSTIGYAAFLAGPPFLGFVGDEVGTLKALLVVAVLLMPAALVVPAARETARAYVEPCPRCVVPSCLALPGLALAVAGLFHPHSLSHRLGAACGRLLHVAGVVRLPARRASALMALVDRPARRRGLGWCDADGVRLRDGVRRHSDVISGIGAGYVTWRLGEGVARPDEVRYLFAIGGQDRGRRGPGR